jgi:hypothetical protein
VSLKESHVSRTGHAWRTLARILLAIPSVTSAPSKPLRVKACLFISLSSDSGALGFSLHFCSSPMYLNTRLHMKPDEALYRGRKSRPKNGRNSLIGVGFVTSNRSSSLTENLPASSKPPRKGADPPLRGSDEGERPRPWEGLCARTTSADMSLRLTSMSRKGGDSGPPRSLVYLPRSSSSLELAIVVSSGQECCEKFIVWPGARIMVRD